MSNRLDPVARARQLMRSLNRTRYGKRQILVADFSDTLQGQDTSRVIDLMPNRRGRFVFRVKYNTKSIDPLASQKYGTPFFDVTKMSDKEVRDHLKREEFDFTLWFKHTKGFKFQRAMDYNVPFIVQVGGCNFHDGSETGGCHFCFVDNKSNDGRSGPGKVWPSATDCVDSFLAAREKIRKIYQERTGYDLQLKVIRISGGEPTMVLPWIVDLLLEIDNRYLSNDIVLQIDTNLSTWNELDLGALYDLESWDAKFLAGMKGCDSANIAVNVQAAQTVSQQMLAFQGLVGCGLDVYPQMYNPNPHTLDVFCELADEFCVKNFSKRLHIGPLKLYGPNRRRLELEARNMEVEGYVDKTVESWHYNYQAAVKVMDCYLRQRYHVGYKDLVRSDVKLSVNI